MAILQVKAWQKTQKKQDIR